MRKFILGIPLLLLSAVCAGEDSIRINQMEKELQEIKVRLAKLDSVLSAPESIQKSLNQSEGWQSVSNWRKLEAGNSPAQVRKILGEPQRLDGGQVANWKYPNGGIVNFISNRVFNWTEPDDE